MSLAATVAAVPSTSRLRRAGAVLAGLAAIFAVTTAVDIVLHATGVFPPLGEPMADALFGLALAYRAAIGVAGSYLTARLAGDRAMSSALALGTVGLVLSIVGAVAMWSFGPHWYPLAVAASALPCSWIGGRLRERQQSRR